MNSIRPFRDIKRRRSKEISVGKVKIGGQNPISVQSMTNTLTTDVKKTIDQVNALHDAGADIVRISCPDEDSTKSLKEIIKKVEVPIIADIHFHYQRAIEAAKDYNCSMRIGVNGGSLEKELLEKYKEPCPEALVESAKKNIALLEENNFNNFKISVKASDIFLAVGSYRLLAKQCEYPLHLGITEAGGLFSGTVKSSIGLGLLLLEGIGDTIRVSLSADPIEEVKAGLEILKSLGLKKRGVNIISCPSCARQAFEVIKTVEILEKRLSHIKESITLSIIGCVVNGPGEAAQTDIGLTGGGKGNNMIYLSGLQNHQVPNDNIIEHVVSLVEKKVDEIRQKKNASN